MALTADDIALLLSTHGRRQYGQEAVSQLDHALQCALQAERAGEATEMVVASLLHDLGHLLAAEQGTDGRSARARAAAERDDMHQYVALPFLRPLLPSAVLEPMRLHVDAKRFLCRAEPGYHAGLSPASQRSLALQGGICSEAEARLFIVQPFAEDAVRLRRYDDGAKVPGLATPGLVHYLPMLRVVVARHRGAAQRAVQPPKAGSGAAADAGTGVRAAFMTIDSRL
jgi:phosphonate degradation associated HDIG domain protein